MKKNRIVALILILAMMLSTCVAAAPATENDSQVIPPNPVEANAAEDAAICYLEEAAYAIYLYEDHNLEQLTIAAISEEDKAALAHDVANYAALRSSQEIAPYEGTDNCFDEISSLEESLVLHQEYVTFYGHINELEKTTYKFFSPTYEVLNTAVNGNLAVVDVCETLDFQYSECDEPSAMTTYYYVSLVKNGGRWLVMAVESDDIFYETYREGGFDLEKEIASVDAAYAHQEISAITTTETPVEENTAQVLPASVSNTDRVYNGNNAAMYALTYSTQSDDGNSVPSYKNERFYWSSASCQLFASQCVWAGFGGSNTQDDINNRLVMDTTGSYQWWSTQTHYNHDNYNDEGSPKDQSYNSWILVSRFRIHAEEVKNSETESGLICDTYKVAHSSDDLVGDSGLTADDLTGAVLHVRGRVWNKTTGKWEDAATAHAIIVNRAEGTTRQSVYYTSYNNCGKNIRLSTRFPKGSTELDEVFVIVPRYFRGCNGASENYLYATLQNAQQMGTTGKTITLDGYAKQEVVTLSLRVYAPGESEYSQYFVKHKTTSVSGEVTLNKVGDWKVEVYSPTVGTYTYIVRVVN